MSWIQTVLFLGLVGLATFCQNLTGFAFGLIFVGIAGATHLLSIEDAANIACLLGIVNGVVYLRAHRVRPDWQLLRPMLLSSVIGLVAGVALLQWLSGNALNVLRMLLGAAIVLCALLLIQQAKPVAASRSAAPMWLAGISSGLLGGLFATPGPPMVYYLYRQPIDALVARQCLFVLFIVSGVLRLGMVSVQGELGSSVLMASALACPVVAGVTWAQAKWPPVWPRRVVQWLVCLLLLLSGASLLISGWLARAA